MQMRDNLPKKLPPRIICQATPGFWHGQQLLAAPHLGYLDPAYMASEGAFAARFAPGNVLLQNNITGQGNV
jgi:hypothetical protein